MKILLSMDSRIRFRIPLREFEKIYSKVYKKLRPRKKVPALELRLVTSQKMKEANRRFRGKNKPTDVLSFGTVQKELLGSLLIDIQTARKQAKTYRHSTLREVQELFLHGLLHLLGYDHENHRDAQAMARLENHFNRLWKTSSPN